LDLRERTEQTLHRTTKVIVKTRAKNKTMNKGTLMTSSTNTKLVRTVNRINHKMTVTVTNNDQIFYRYSTKRTRRNN
jgi:hypothetical protein